MEVLGDKDMGHRNQTHNNMVGQIKSQGQVTLIMMIILNKVILVQMNKEIDRGIEEEMEELWKKTGHQIP